MVAQVADTLPEEWKYVSEGGATIVFSYIGPSNPQFDGTVLRLRKSATSTDPAGDELDEPDDPMIEYQQKCMQRLIPLKHLPRLESASITREWLDGLVALHDLERPADRRTKDRIDLARRKGVLATDLVGGDWLAVEIKPKWAFLPSSAHLSGETRNVKLQTCRFCMHSVMRMNNGEGVYTGYCPLDLFSGQEDRVRKAIQGLWNAWIESNGTVNNLKIFVHGKMIKPFQAGSMFATSVNSERLTGKLFDTFVSALLPPLLQTPVLQTLSTLQRTLDVLDIEGLFKLWRGAASSSLDGDLLLPPEPTMSDWSYFLDTYLSPTGVELDYTKPAPEHLHYYLLAYLLSATFKDCSIIVRLDRLRSTEAVPDVKPEQIIVIDLDPKSMARLRKWEKLDQEIAKAYTTINGRKVCIDAWRTTGVAHS